jgi:hypothetical protein
MTATQHTRAGVSTHSAERHPAQRRPCRCAWPPASARPKKHLVLLVRFPHKEGVDCFGRKAFPVDGWLVVLSTDGEDRALQQVNPLTNYSWDPEGARFFDSAVSPHSRCKCHFGNPSCLHLILQSRSYKRVAALVARYWTETTRSSRERESISTPVTGTANLVSRRSNNGNRNKDLAVSVRFFVLSI